MLTIDSFGEGQLREVAEKVKAYAGATKVWLLEGEMGAGKTTFVRALCENFGVEDHVSSPTFSIVNEYRTGAGEIVYHFDLYRLKNEAEAFDIGMEEYLDANALCLIEWPDKIPSLLPDAYLQVQLSVNEDHSRTIKLTKHEG